MAQEDLNVGTGPDTGTGDSYRAAFIKIQSNFNELYAAITNGEAFKSLNNPTIVVGDLVGGKKSGINDGNFFIGYVLTNPPTTNAHINFEYQN